MRNIKKRIVDWAIVLTAAAGCLLMLCAAGASDAGEDILTTAPRAFLGLALFAVAVAAKAVKQEREDREDEES